MSGRSPNWFLPIPPDSVIPQGDNEPIADQLNGRRRRRATRWRRNPSWPLRLAISTPPRSQAPARPPQRLCRSAPISIASPIRHLWRLQPGSRWLLDTLEFFEPFLEVHTKFRSRPIRTELTRISVYHIVVFVLNFRQYRLHLVWNIKRKTSPSILYILPLFLLFLCWTTGTYISQSISCYDLFYESVMLASNCFISCVISSVYYTIPL
jgi:hypothetical protein